MSISAEQVRNEIISEGWKFFADKFAQQFMQQAGLASIGGKEDFREDIEVLLNHHHSLIKCIKDGNLPGRHMVNSKTGGDYAAASGSLVEVFCAIAPSGKKDSQPIIFDRQELLKRCRAREARELAGRNRPLNDPEKQFTEDVRIAYALFGHRPSPIPGNGDLNQDWKGFEFCLFVQVLAFLFVNRNKLRRAGKRGYFEGDERLDILASSQQYGFCEDAVSILPELGLLLTKTTLRPTLIKNFKCEGVHNGVAHLKWELPMGANCRCDSVLLDRKLPEANDDKWDILIERLRKDEHRDDRTSVRGERFLYRVRSVYQKNVDEAGPTLMVWIPAEPRVQQADWAGNTITLRWIAGRNSRRTILFRSVDARPSLKEGKPENPGTEFLKSVEESDFVDNGILSGHTYCYLLVAEYEDGSWSDGKLVEVVVPPPPDPPKSVRANYQFDERSGESKVEIIADVHGNNPEVRYDGFRRAVEEGRQIQEGGNCIFQAAAATSWLDTTAEAGKRYLYCVVPSCRGIRGKHAISNSVDVVPGVCHLECDEADRTVVLHYEASSAAKEVWISRCELNQKPESGVRIIANSFTARDTSLENYKTYHYWIACRYVLPGGVDIWSSWQIKSATPRVKPEAVSLNPRIEDGKVVCGLGDPRGGALVVIRTMERIAFGKTISIPDLERIQGRSLDVMGRLAIDYEPVPTEPYYTVFTRCDQEGFALVGDCRRCAYVPDVSKLQWFAVPGGVRLTWNWPAHCRDAVILTSTKGEPGTPVADERGRSVVWACDGCDVVRVQRDQYEEDGDSVFLGMAPDAEHHIKVLAFVHTAISPGVETTCKSLIDTAQRAWLDYNLRRSNGTLVLSWRAEPELQIGFDLVASEGKPPAQPIEGTVLYSAHADNWPAAHANGFRRSQVPWPFNGKGYCRLFVRETDSRAARVSIRHPDGILSPIPAKTEIVQTTTLRLHSRPREVLCPYCFEKFKWWRVLLLQKTSPTPCPTNSNPQPDTLAPVSHPESVQSRPRETPLPLWWRMLGIAHLQQAAPQSKGFREWLKVCPKRCKTEIRDRNKPAVDLDNALFQDPSLHLGLLGTMGVGKSHWIFGACRRLEAAGLTPIDEPTRTELEKMRRRVIDEKSILEPTKRSDDSIIPPMLFHASTTGGKAVLCFCDVDGERWGIFGNAGKMRYLWSSQALVYIVDPLQISSVRSLLIARSALPEDAPKDTGKEQECMPQVTALDNLLKALRERETAPYRKPIAVVVSKGDAIRDHDAGLRKALWEQPSYHEHRATLQYDLALHWRVQFAVRDFLLQHEPALLPKIEGNFQHFAYFCVSPTGCSAQKKKFARFAPWRVEEPVMWILAKLGFISTT